MELISILRILWARRRLVVLALLVSAIVGVFVAYRVSPTVPPLHSRQYNVGVASASVLVDTPQSQVADLSPAALAGTGAPNLNSLASLYAKLFAIGSIQDQISQLAGVPFRRLATTEINNATAPVATPLAGQSSAAPSASPWQLNISVDPTLPLITIQTQAPTPQQAGRMATASVRSLRGYLDTVAAQQQIPASKRPVVNELGTPVIGLASRGPRRLYGLVAALFVFLLACTMIVVSVGLRRRWQESRVSESTRAVPDQGAARENNPQPSNETKRRKRAPASNGVPQPAQAKKRPSRPRRPPAPSLAEAREEP